MNAASIKQALGGVAPALATILGGPLAGNAVNSIIGALFGKDATPSPEEIQARFGQLSTVDIYKLKELETKFVLEEKRINLEREKLPFQDVKNARAREIELSKSGNKDNTQKILAYIVTSGFFVMLFFLCFLEIPTDMKDVIYLMAGGLISAFSMVLGYYFGTSASSKAKDDTIASHLSTISHDK